jgi:hypothetical protein
MHLVILSKFVRFLEIFIQPNGMFWNRKCFEQWDISMLLIYLDMLTLWIITRKEKSGLWLLRTVSYLLARKTSFSNIYLKIKSWGWSNFHLIWMNMLSARNISMQGLNKIHSLSLYKKHSSKTLTLFTREFQFSHLEISTNQNSRSSLKKKKGINICPKLNWGTKWDLQASWQGSWILFQIQSWSISNSSHLIIIKKCHQIRSQS